MFYSLFTYFNQIPGARLVTYISFRALVAAGLAFIISMYFGKFFIGLMRRKNISEEQRDESIVHLFCGVLLSLLYSQLCQSSPP